MDISGFEERANRAEQLCAELATKVEALEHKLLNSRSTTTSSTTSTSNDTVPLSEYQKLLKEVKELKADNARHQYRANHLVRCLNEEEAKTKQHASK
ncbi:hypothetical protein SAMD00019534_039830 [Acytostelium subglobosum LB1]|uniref:hypothetical protein n=1 Tax=Acytostelium subglobosum LB1 TaxID=1410327 RepID=UPI000644FBAD|nr:hypothetical protein SAMD00019534_039830 [Acytostelium subglobosum LB1]GAM20808.1 hypothetical protein SAMD00019534_039830 [Acytostelium subglobosum LB1]|eukprot:XP_012755942.1 hypothetical protein SAMD00019534_039830 [Acytostelium subglobosum LB1]